jgi:Tol biopolymer transport system component
MRLSPGTQLGVYEVVGELGAGGMGEVYRARDTTLHREVAIKLVNPAFCGDPDSLARLRREARALASLNHPHVATVHELAEFEGFCGVVMELVAGETLAEAIARRPLPLGDALRIGAQVAAALEAAHERGLVHRDLKPANIKITPDGSAKVLDFGLAKAEAGESDASGVPLSTMATAAGVVVGTVSYMSPEQARGAPVDRRTDIWAFGCVLFEMLTGRRAFDGPTATDTLVMILEREPEWSWLPQATPGMVKRLLRRCLQKDARRRLRDAGDLRLELEEAATPSGLVDAAAGGARRRLSRAQLAALAVFGAVVGAGATALILRRQAPAPPPEIRFDVALPAGERLGATDFPALAISPDGRLVAYVAARGAGTQLVLRRLDATDAVPLPGTTNAISPFFSPDNQWIAFFADGSLKKVPIGGGPPVTISEADTGFGGSWGSDGTIVFAPTTGSPLSRVPATGGTPARATRLDAERGEFSHRWPELLPDCRTVLFTVGTVGEWDEAEIVAQSLESGERAVVLKGGTHPHYLPSGHLLYTHAGAVWIAPFDAKQLKTTGPPSRALDGVTASADGAAQFAVSRSGTAIYVAAAADAAGRRLVVVDGADVTPLAAPAHPYVAPRVSPNGRRLAVAVANQSEHIWMYDLSAGALKQLTFDAANRAPIWTADDERVTFSSTRSGALNLFVVPVDGSGAAERLTTSDNVQIAGSWSPDGSVLAFVEQRPGSGRDIFLLRRGSEPAPWASSAFDESAPRFSPDGRWIAYVSNESGRAEIFVGAAAAAAPARQLSTDGGTEPVWARDGHALFFRAGGRLMAVPIVDAAALRVGPARQMFEGAVEPGTLDVANYDVMSGATRFVMVASPSAETRTSDFRVVVNWNPFSAPSP